MERRRSGLEEEVEAAEVVVGVLVAVAWMARASPSVKGEVAAHDVVMYCQKASLVHRP